MAVEGITITLEEVTSTASSIRTQNNRLGDILANIRNQMNNLQRSWDSEAYRTIKANFDKLSTPFENYRQITESYADFLDKTVASYQNTESTNVSNAAAFE